MSKKYKQLIQRRKTRITKKFILKNTKKNNTKLKNKKTLKKSEKLNKNNSDYFRPSYLERRNWIISNTAMAIRNQDT